MISNREIAGLFWLLVVILFCIKKDKKVITSIRRFFAVFFSKSFLIRCFGPAAVYVVTTTLLLYHIGYWELGLISNTIGWFIGFAFVSSYRVTEQRRGTKFYRDLVLLNIGILVIVELLCTNYTFGLLIEFFLVPFVGYLAMLNVYTSRKDEFKVVAKITNFLLVVVGSITILNAVHGAYRDIDNFISCDSLRYAALPLVYSITFLPFLYLFSIYVAYDDLICRLKFKQGSRVTFRTILSVFLECRLSRDSLMRFQRRMYEE